MKRKFLILTLCFTIVFSSINFKNSYAYGGVISLPILATVSSLAVGTGIVISSNDDLYDLGRIFYDYIDRHNDLTWATVQSVFASSVSLQSNKLVSVKSDFLDIVKEFFNNTFTYPYDVSYSDVGIPIIEKYTSSHAYSLNNFPISIISSGSYSVGNFDFVTTSYDSFFGKYKVDVFYKGSKIHSNVTAPTVPFSLCYSVYNNKNSLFFTFLDPSHSIGYGSTVNYVNNYVESLTYPYKGGYTWDNVESKKENESIALPIPGDLSSLVGQGSTDFWDNSDSLVGSGDISIPNVENPSISLDNTASFPDTNVDNPSIPDVDNPSIPDVDNPSIDNGLEIFPPWGGGIDFTPVTQSSFTDKFPFSLGSDIKNILSIFDVDPIAPKFKVPIVSETIELDLTEFEQLASIIRFFVLVGFIISLILITRSVIG